MNKVKSLSTAVVLFATLAVAPSSAAPANLGYTNTPFIPGTQWHVHDGTRPVPRVVQSGATFSHLAPAPSDAIVLFDGTDLSKWTGPGDQARWKVENGYMEVAPKSGSIRTRDKFADFQLHLEFATPAKVEGNSQGRGNSGILFNGIYEVQVLDSWNNPTYPDGQAGALYGQWPPLVNAVRRPGEWQSYDIVFEAPRFDGPRLIKPASMTVFLNGVLLHNRRELMGATVHRALPNYAPQPAEDSLVLQDHQQPVRYRNIWIRRLVR
jgi:hypothetical protein